MPRIAFHSSTRYTACTFILFDHLCHPPHVAGLAHPILDGPTPDRTKSKQE